MDFLRRLLQQLAAFWTQQLGLGGRLLLSAAMVLAVAAVGYVIYTSQQVEYSPLPYELTPDEAAAITQRLDQQAVPYRLERGGARILVPSDRVARVRMDLAVARLPSGPGPGWKLFDEQSPFGTDPFYQNLNFVRAQQDELARTIGTLEPIEEARVHIVPAEETPFLLRDQKPVTAAVTLRAKSGARIDKRTVEGIVHLISSSVKGLEPSHVTVVDHRGRLLSERPDDADGLGANARQLEFQQLFEEHLVKKAEAVIQRVMGNGDAIVRITTDLDFRRVKQISDTFDPEARAADIEKSENEKSTGGTTGGFGVAGTQSNVPPNIAPGQGSAGGGQERTFEKNDAHYLVSRTQRWVDDMVGAVQRMTVAVMLVPPVAADDPTKAVDLPLTVLDVENLVKQAVGFNATRGDQIQVTLSKPPPELMPKSAIQKQIEQVSGYITIGWQVSGLVGAIALVLIVLIALMRRRRRMAREAEEAELSPELERLQAIADVLRMWLEQA